MSGVAVLFILLMIMLPTVAVVRCVVIGGGGVGRGLRRGCG